MDSEQSQQKDEALLLAEAVVAMEQEVRKENKACSTCNGLGIVTYKYKKSVYQYEHTEEFDLGKYVKPPDYDVEQVTMKCQACGERLEECKGPLYDYLEERGLGRDVANVLLQRLRQDFWVGVQVYPNQEIELVVETERGDVTSVRGYVTGANYRYSPPYGVVELQVRTRGPYTNYSPYSGYQRTIYEGFRFQGQGE